MKKCDLKCSLKDIFLYFFWQEKIQKNIIVIFFIHKTKFLNMLPRFDVFLAEILLIVKSLKHIDNNKNNKVIKAYDDIFLSD